jgi:hypothetical protein
MKWITCSLIGAGPSVAGGAAVCFFAAGLEQVVRQALGLEAHVDHRRAHQLDGLRVGALRKVIAAALPGRKLFCPSCAAGCACSS